MTFTVTLHPAERAFDVARDETILSAAIRAGVGLPYGCRDGACGSCKSKLRDGRVIHGAHQPKALSDARGGRRPDPHLLRHAADRLRRRGAHGGGRRRVPDQQDARPRAEHGAPEPPTWPSCASSCPRRSRSATAPASTSSSSCATARAAATRWPTRRTTSARRPSIELHLRHMPGGKFTDHVFGAMKEKDILRMEGPFGSFFLREESDKPIVLLASGTGFAPIKALIEQLHHLGSIRPVRLYWGARRAGRHLPRRLDRHRQGAAAAARVRAGAVGARPPRTPGRAAPASSTRP